MNKFKELLVDYYNNKHNSNITLDNIKITNYNKNKCFLITDLKEDKSYYSIDLVNSKIIELEKIKNIKIENIKKSFLDTCYNLMNQYESKIVKSKCIYYSYILGYEKAFFDSDNYSYEITLNKDELYFDVYNKIN